MKLVVLELKESLEKQDREVQLDQQAYEVNVDTDVLCVLYTIVFWKIIVKMMHANCS